MIDAAMLTRIVEGLSLERVSGPGVSPICVSIIPPLDNLRIVDAIAGQLDLTFLTKNVVLNNPLVEPTLTKAALDPGVVKSLPVLGGVTGILDVLHDREAAGLLGRIQGSLPLPVDVPVRVKVSASVREKAEDPRTEIAGSSVNIARDGSSNLCVTIAPQFRELTDSVAVETVTYWLVVSVSLSVGAVDIPPHDLPPLPIQVPVIRIPSVCILFEHPNFGGKALIMVPSSSPLGALEALNEALALLDSALQTVSSVIDIASLLLPLHQVQGLLGSTPGASFQHGDELPKLQHILLHKTPWWNPWDVMWDEEASSAILVGPDNRSVLCYNDDVFDDRYGAFEMWVAPGELITRVSDLEADAPMTTPRERLEVLLPADSALVENFGDELESVKFSWRMHP